MDIDESRQAIWRLVLQGLLLRRIIVSQYPIYLTVRSSMISAAISFLTIVLPVGAAQAEFVTLNSNSDLQIEFVTIGDPGNPADEPDYAGFVYGSVDYVYQIMKYEMTCELENELFPERVTSCAFGNDVPEKIGYGDAIEIANRLNVDQGYPMAYNRLSNGVVRPWPEDYPGFDPANPYRNFASKFFVVGQDETDKAAYFDPSMNEYWDTALATNDPRIVSEPSTEPGTYICCDGNVFVSAFLAGGESPYGTVAQWGHFPEWEENRGISAMGLQGRAYDFISNSAVRLVMLPDAAKGDFNRDGIIDESDIDQLTSQILSGEVVPIRYDVSGDGLVNSDDRIHWVGEIVDTTLGDANLDGVVDFADFLAMSSEFNGESGWAGGDFDGDGNTEFSDFLLMSQNYGSGEFASVPEPGSDLQLCVSLTVLAILARKRLQ